MVQQVNGFKLDKSHTFAVNLFDDVSRYMQIPDEYEAPEDKEFEAPVSARHPCCPDIGFTQEFPARSCDRQCRCIACHPRRLDSFATWPYSPGGSSQMSLHHACFLCSVSAAPEIMPAVCAGGLLVMVDERKGAQLRSAGMVLRGRKSQCIQVVHFQAA